NCRWSIPSRARFVVESTWPNEALSQGSPAFALKLPQLLCELLGLAKWGVLVRFMAWARTWRLKRSESLKLRDTPASMLKTPGPSNGKNNDVPKRCSVAARGA